MSDRLDKVWPPPLSTDAPSITADAPRQEPRMEPPRTEPDIVLQPGEIDRLRNIGMPVADIDAGASVVLPRQRRPILGKLIALCVILLAGAGLAFGWQQGYGEELRHFAAAQMHRLTQIATQFTAPTAQQSTPETAPQMPLQAETPAVTPPFDAGAGDVDALKQQIAQLVATQAVLEKRLATLEAGAATATANTFHEGGSGWLDDPAALARATAMLPHPVAAPPPRPAVVRPRPQPPRAPLPRPQTLPPPAPIVAAPPPPPPPAPNTPVPPQPIPGR